jgi:hypothetical protein
MDLPRSHCIVYPSTPCKGPTNAVDDGLCRCVLGLFVVSVQSKCLGVPVTVTVSSQLLTYSVLSGPSLLYFVVFVINV